MSNFNSMKSSLLAGDRDRVDGKIGNSFNDVFGESGSLNPPKPKAKGVYAVDAKKAKKEDPHAHPMQTNSRVEMRPNYFGSLGDIKDEGCETHEGVRYILNSDTPIELHNKSKMKEYIVFSEILGKPKCKK